MNFLTRLQLSAMMFLNFFVWGIWFVTMNVYLKSIDATDVQVGLAYGTQALGAIIAPFVIGLIADRFFDAQKILGILHLAGAALMYYITTVDDFSSFYPILLVYMILFMPTLALVNAISFKQMSNPEKEFSYIRLWGTIGWIATGWVITMMGWERDQSLVNTFLTAAVVSLALGIYSFTLPKRHHQRQVRKFLLGNSWIRRIRIIKRQEFPYIFYIVIINMYTACILLPAYKLVFK
jgi:MFS family permease